ncbi:hypothetical protein CPC08DRAFT_671595 [Agrocybe pediades]|nr:hypothetical protein CPC08DRAFT_671595 [Agrocybe pediades]
MGDRNLTTLLRLKMLVDPRYYRDVFSRIKKPQFAILDQPDYLAANQSLEAYMAYGLGSGQNGIIITQVTCANASFRAPFCTKDDIQTLKQCSLVKYCSGRCQRQHWSKHRLDCEYKYLDVDWQPEWANDNREPLLSELKYLPLSCSIDQYKNVGLPPYDVLQLRLNEAIAGKAGHLKICMASSADIRNLVTTVNNLPKASSERIDFLINNTNAVVLNRMLVILCVLLSPGPSVDEAAELATHLMYSSLLPETAASYVRYCANMIYGEELKDGEITFQASLRTRGRGRVHSAQPASSIKRITDMLYSNYSLARAMNSRKEVVLDPLQIDDRHKLLSSLSPSHRVSLDRFWNTGVLAPFSLDVKSFKSPNRLLFDAQGEWIGTTSAISPLHGWDIRAIRETGIKHGIDPTGDILGCVFFHIKSKLREFCLRVKEMNINIHLSQYDSRLLSKGISIGVLPAFADASFDRIDVGDLADQVGAAECLADWGPLLNQTNSHSCLLMHSKKWHEEFPQAIARNNPRAVKILMQRCERMPSLKLKLKNFFRGPQAPSLVRLMASLDAFVDHEATFLQYLDAHEVQETAASLGLRLRQDHLIHPKRVAVPLHSDAKLPNLCKEEYYDIFVAGGADLTLRFAEFGFANVV